MKSFWERPWLEWLIAAACAANAWPLVEAWGHSPRDRFGWAALALWLAPAARRLVRTGGRGWRPGLLGAALAAALAGRLADLHALAYAALACAVAAPMPWRARTLWWLLCAVSWMPGLGWRLPIANAGGGFAVRLALAAAGVAAVWPRAGDSEQEREREEKTQ